jgi:hypothetical protein
MHGVCFDLRTCWRLDDLLSEGQVAQPRRWPKSLCASLGALYKFKAAHGSRIMVM